ncbi:MraY family glycosyltransferase [Desulfitobacterium sp. THU1]|uniref:glycosyltransferase family 4 protein n=1 Tax=Desulfitobacterium sp. THU1 TaxID=3138072 RepID=UPI00311FE9C5
MSFSISLALTVILIPLVIRYRIIDKPNYRSIHTRETPKAGGIAILLGLLGGLFISGQGTALLALVLLMVGATTLGLLDDLKNLSPNAKLIAQLALALLTTASGYQFVLFGNLLDTAITVIWIIGLMNAFNLIDGMDGLAGGVAGIATLIFFALGVPSLETIALPLLGAILGFLIYNFRPAKIFMGDTGSMLLGYLLAVMGILVQRSAESPWVGGAVTLLILAYPLFDTALSIIRRKANHKPIFAPDRSHSYNLLMDHLGLGYLTTVFTVYGVTACGGLLGFLTYTRQSLALAAISLIVVIATMIIFVARYHLLAESRYEKH